MSADAWRIFNKFKEYLGDGVLDMDGDEFNMELYTSSSNCNVLTNSVKSDLTNEVATANGYTQGGKLLTNVTWTESSGTITWDCDDQSWTASGGSITARYAVIRANEVKAAATGTITNPLVAYSLLDNSPADVTVTNGNTLTAQINASGVFQLSGG